MTPQAHALRYALRVCQVYHGSLVPEDPVELARRLREDIRTGDRPDSEQALARLEEVFPEINQGKEGSE